MAWLQQDPSGNFHVCFRFGGKKFKRSLKTKLQRTAQAKKGRLEENIALIHSGRLELPAGADVPTFLLSDGKLGNRIVVKSMPLTELLSDYFSAIPNNGVEEPTLKMMQIHGRHLERLLGERFDVQRLGFNDVQGYINKRSLEPGNRGKTIQASTIKKELTTLRNIWNWGIQANHLSDLPFPSNGIRYPKSKELPPFKTFEEVQVLTNGLAPGSDESKELWASVFLNLDEIKSLLEFVQENARSPFVYPMFATAAYTGARRSELIRSETGDLTNSTIQLREKKRKKKTLTTRMVPVSETLQGVLSDWLEIKPESRYTFCPEASERDAPITFSATVEKIRSRYNPGLRLGGVILGNFDKSTKLDAQVHQTIARLRDSKVKQKKWQRLTIQIWRSMSIRVLKKEIPSLLQSTSMAFHCTKN